jgi:hypothetical protein
LKQCVYNVAMDDWHARLARDLMSETPARGAPDGAASIEIGLGQARSAIAYALELARAHRLPATGSLAGDDVWLRMGDGRVRFTLNRREAHVRVDVQVPGSPGASSERVVHWDDAQRLLVDQKGTSTDLAAIARVAIDAIVADWRAGPASETKVSSAPPPDLDDEPTKG